MDDQISKISENVKNNFTISDSSLIARTGTKLENIQVNSLDFRKTNKARKKKAQNQRKKKNLPRKINIYDEKAVYSKDELWSLPFLEFRYFCLVIKGDKNLFMERLRYNQSFDVNNERGFIIKKFRRRMRRKQTYMFE